MKKSICLLANSKNGDIQGARLMRTLRSLTGDDSLGFFGYGGKWMEREGGFTSEMDIENLTHKDFQTFRKTRPTEEATYYRYSPLNFINAHFLRTCDAVMERLNDVQYAKRIYQGRPSLILSIDNEYLTWSLYDQLNSYYLNSSVPKPQRQYLGRFVRDYRKWTAKYADFVHYTVPLELVTHNYYEFPSQYIGQNGVYRALRHLYAQGGRDDLLGEHSLFVSRNRFGLETERLRNQARTRFRAELEIPEDNFVIFVAPGNDREEVEWCMDNLRKGVKEFLLKYSAPTSLSPVAAPMDKFTTILSLHKGSKLTLSNPGDGEAVAKTYLEKTEWMGDLKIVSSDDDGTYVDAMAASDAGFIYDGDLVGAAAMAHLPIAILIKMRMHHQWYHDLYNRWWNSMNVLADNNIYPEFIGGEAWFGKMCDTLGYVVCLIFSEWYLKPAKRYDQVRKWEHFLKEAMAYKKIDRSVHSESRDLIVKGEAVDQFYDPYYLLASQVLAQVQAYEDPFAASAVAPEKPTVANIY